MNDITRIDAAGVQTMSSREIAELCEKRHDNVMRDIRDMLAQLHGERGLLKFEDTYRNPQNGQEYPIFLLPKRETLILVSGYRLDLRARIIDRWQELEERARRPVDPMQVLNDPAAMRGLLLSYSEKVLALEERNAALAPKAEALDRIATAHGSLCLTDAASALQMRRKDFLTFLHANRWIFRRVGNKNWLAYHDKRQAGWMEHKVSTITDRDGEERVVESVRVTPKGLARLAEIIGVKLDAA